MTKQSKFFGAYTTQLMFNHFLCSGYLGMPWVAVESSERSLWLSPRARHPSHVAPLLISE